MYYQVRPASIRYKYSDKKNSLFSYPIPSWRPLYPRVLTRIVSNCHGNLRNIHLLTLLTTTKLIKIVSDCSQVQRTLGYEAILDIYNIKPAWKCTDSTQDVVPKGSDFQNKQAAQPPPLRHNQMNITLRSNTNLCS